MDLEVNWKKTFDGVAKVEEGSFNGGSGYKVCRPPER